MLHVRSSSSLATFPPGKTAVVPRVARGQKSLPPDTVARPHRLFTDFPRAAMCGHPARQRNLAAPVSDSVVGHTIVPGAGRRQAEAMHLSPASSRRVLWPSVDERFADKHTPVLCQNKWRPPPDPGVKCIVVA